MKIIGFIRSIFDKKYSCEYFIDNIETTYNQYKKQWPKESQHSLLAHTWLSYMAAKGININDNDVQEAAGPTTYLVACVPSTNIPRALGLFLLFRERPYIFREYNNFQEEFDNIFLPILEAQKKGTIEKIYKKYNY